MAQMTAVPRLSAWRLTGDAYDIWFASLGQWLKAAALPLALTLLLDFALRHSQLQAGGPGPFVGGLRPVLWTIVEAIIYTLLGVAWHRWAILSERPRLLPPITGQHLRFLAWALALTFLTQFAWGSVFQIFLALSELSRGMIVLGAIGGVVVSLYFLSRVSLLYPAAALGDRLGLLGAWEMTRKQGWALFWAFVLVCIPMVLGFLLFGAVLGGAILGAFAGGVPIGHGLPGSLTWFFGAAFSAVFSLALLTLPVGVASSAYRRLNGAARRPAPRQAI